MDRWCLDWMGETLHPEIAGIDGVDSFGTEGLKSMEIHGPPKESQVMMMTLNPWKSMGPDSERSSECSVSIVSGRIPQMPDDGRPGRGCPLMPTSGLT